VAAGVAASWPEASPLSPDHAGGDRSWAWLYLAAAAAAFCVYLAALWLLRRGGRLRLVLAVAGCVQLLPLAGPVLLSTDAYTYWMYGRVAAVHGGNPYVDEPRGYPDDPAYPRMGADWRDTTSVYGPAFALASEGHAAAVGGSPAAAAWTFRVLAAGAVLALAALAARLGRPPALAAAFVGWNPLLAFHFAGGGHNDSWMAALAVAAIALAASGKRQWAGASWASAIAVKWVAAIWLPLRLLEARAGGREVRHLGFAAAAALVVAVATARYELDWLRAFGPLAENLERQARYSIPHRLTGLGLSGDAAAWLLAGLFVLAYVWLLREARRGRARLALAAGLLLVASPWLVPWYAVWVVPLAAIEEDRLARLLALALSAYLLRDAVPI
jgi:hypothetical protein